MNTAARANGLPIFVEQLKPKINDTFWVNLIGRGYPAPRPNKVGNAIVRSELHGVS